jgi:hypothetical protein
MGNLNSSTPRPIQIGFHHDRLGVDGLPPQWTVTLGLYANAASLMRNNLSSANALASSAACKVSDRRLRE